MIDQVLENIFLPFAWEPITIPKLVEVRVVGRFEHVE